MSSIATVTSLIQPKRFHTASIIFLHGLGGSGQVGLDLLKPYYSTMFEQDLSHVKWIFPSAAKRPVTMVNSQEIPAWYDIKGKNAVDYLLNSDRVEDVEGIQASSNAVHDLIEQEISRGIPSDKIIIAGISQGGALALYSGLVYPKKLGGVVAINSYLPCARKFLAWNSPIIQQPKSTPFHLCHGQRDNVVLHSFGLWSYYGLKFIMRMNATFQSYPDLDHFSTNTRQVEDLQKYITGVLGKDEEIHM